MISFDSQLRQLVDDWRERGEPLESLITTLKDEMENLRELQALGET